MSKEKKILEQLMHDHNKIQQRKPTSHQEIAQPPVIHGHSQIAGLMRK
jgi:hypothetical protein